MYNYFSITYYFINFRYYILERFILDQFRFPLKFSMGYKFIYLQNINYLMACDAFMNIYKYIVICYLFRPVLFNINHVSLFFNSFICVFKINMRKNEILYIRSNILCTHNLSMNIHYKTILKKYEIVNFNMIHI